MMNVNPPRAELLRTAAHDLLRYADTIEILAADPSLTIPIETLSTVPSSTIPTMDQIKRAWIAKALIVTGGNRVEAAKLLDIGVRTIYRYIGA
jgi:transcriptional regulator of acetoin/glycerol metabolism